MPKDPEPRTNKNPFLGTSFNPSQDLRNDLTTHTIEALSMDFRKAVANGTYNKQQIVRVYEPSKISQAFSQALHWQISLQNSCDAKHVEISKKEKKLA